MSQPTDTGDSLSPLKRAILEIREMRARITQLEGQHHQPIAIIGAGMHLPGGVRDEATLWKLLSNGIDAVSEIPADRWDLDAFYDADPDAPGKMNTRHGAFLTGVDLFDAPFFGVSPREAASMDPQQRLVLETAWEALENAGIAPSRLAGSPLGVFLGLANSDYWRLVFRDTSAIDAYSALGNSYSVAAGRLAYFLGVHGPAMVVDTACSASLVSIHLACRSLRAGECTIALAGGVNLILSPEANINFSKSRMLAPDGKCKTFDAAADGYVRGEGCGIVILKPLAAAQADGDRILAVIRGSAVNQDGRSAGLTAPNGPAQEAVIRAALADAGVQPHEISYLEAHGTGTSLGDPIELRAAHAVLGRSRPKESPLAVGSIKTNIGHLEAAAGVAGLLKVVAALRHKQLPPHLHLQAPTPHFPWKDTSVVVPTELTPWKVPAGRRIAGLSSFGFSGTNAHLIIEEAPETDSSAATNPVERPQHVLAVSAKDADALRQRAVDLMAVLDRPDAPSAADLCHSANTGRCHFPHRAGIIASSSAEIREALGALAAGQSHPRLLTKITADAARPPVAFLFTGQGSQRQAMAQRLYAASPVFRSALDQCADILGPLLGKPLLEVLFAGAAAPSEINQTAYAQPALFAIEYALAEVWKSWGVKPDYVLGHSVGEFAAACVAGALTLEQGLRLIAERGRLMQELPPGGRMVSVAASLERVRPVVAARADVSIAAVNGPESIVISGSESGVAELLRRFSAEGIRTTALNVSHAFHSPLMEPMLDAFASFAAGIKPADPRIGLVSNVTGDLADRTEFGRPEYWRRHVREAVQFAQGVNTLKQQGVRTFIEIGPAPVLLGLARRCLQGDGFAFLPSLRAEKDDWTQLLESLQEYYVNGGAVDWRGFDRGYARRRVTLPAYPFQRRRYWIEARTGSSVAFAPRPDQAWHVATAAALRQSRSVPLEVNVASYPAKWDALERLTTAHAAETLGALGAFTRAGETHDPASLIAAFGIPAMYHHLLQRWLERLAAAGHLRAADKRFVADRPLPRDLLGPATARVETLLADDPHLLAYLRNCSDKLVGVIAGRESPLETLFPGGSSALADRLYDSANPNRYVNSVAGAAVEAVSRAWVRHRPLRILEVGAGTGGTTSTLLPALDPARSDYLFTDVSDMFLGRAREKFGRFDFARFGVFDLGKDLPSQGHVPQAFDIVVGANVVHAVQDLHGTLDRLRTLLVPGGFLLLIEATQHHAWFDFTTGLIEGWQHFADDLRGDNPLLPPETWRKALAAHGFAEVNAYPEVGSPALVFGQHVILARAPGGPDDPAAADSFAGASLPGRQVATSAESPAAVEAQADSAGVLRAKLAGAVADEREEILQDFVCARVMQVLRLPQDRRPDRKARLMDLGLDSLMAVQLRNLVESGLGIERVLPATLMFDYPTIEAIAQFLLPHVLPDPTSAAPTADTASGRASAPAQAESARARELEALSDEEAEALLMKRLERK